MNNSSENMINNEDILDSSLGGNNKIGPEAQGDEADKNDKQIKTVTKGLKLTKETKDKLDLLQSNFGDAETTIKNLISHYEAFKITNDSKFSDRKAEIDRFNYLTSSLVEAYVNSLDMAYFVEDKLNERIVKETRKNQEVITELTEERSKLNSALKESSAKLEEIKEENETIKSSYGKLNSTLSILEKELIDKSEIIKNQQSHIESLLMSVEEGKANKNKVDELVKKNKNLNDIINDNRVIIEGYKAVEKDLESKIVIIKDLRDELKESRDYSNELNQKIQNILTSNSEEIKWIREEYERKLNELKDKNEIKMDAAKQEIDALKEERSNLKEEVWNLTLQLRAKNN